MWIKRKDILVLLQSLQSIWKTVHIRTRKHLDNILRQKNGNNLEFNILRGHNRSVNRN